MSRREQIAENIFTLSFLSTNIARTVLPGQFLNIKVSQSFDPLLRRAYSVHRTDGDEVEIIFNIVGKGSAVLADKRPGDVVSLLGPLGTPFIVEASIPLAVLISGGVGIAPMPLLQTHLARHGIAVTNVHGGKTRAHVVADGRLINAIYATDDGSLGVRGNVIDALDIHLATITPGGTRLYACGPNHMLSALATYAADRGLDLHVSLECQMACGVGICQGCPVEMSRGDRRYSLVCTQGPNYNARDIVIDSLPQLH